MPWTVNWQVYVDGDDMTAALKPFLMTISVTDRDGASSDSCDLTLDDTGAQIKLPRDGAKVRVLLEGVQVFFGTVDEVRSIGTRNAGREIRVQAKGVDSRGKAKERLAFHKDDATLEEFLKDAARNAGLVGLKIDPDLAGIRRDYWAADNESFMHLGQRLAREFNATFKIRAFGNGDVAVLVPRGKDQGLPVIEGEVGRNVLDWDIAPLTGRATFTKGRARWFDRETATFREKEIDFEIDREDFPESVDVVGRVLDDEDQADEVLKGRKEASARESGEGTVRIDLAVEAQAEAEFILKGARPGIDGSYRIVSVTHRADRTDGSTTTLELKQPQKEAGKDKRKPTDARSSSSSSRRSSSTPAERAAETGPNWQEPFDQL